MAKISTYGPDITLNNKDKVLGSSYVRTVSGVDEFETKNFTLEELNSFFTSEGSALSIGLKDNGGIVRETIDNVTKLAIDLGASSITGQLANADLANSSITINGTAISLGGTVTTPNTQLTDSQVRSKISVTGGGSYDSSTGVITIPAGFTLAQGNVTNASVSGQTLTLTRQSTSDITFTPTANDFTDTLKTKLDNIESNATADQTAAEIRTLVEAATDSNVFTDNDHTKLDNIEANATADQTASEIKTLYESNSDTNAFTDADHTKLDNIEANATADQTNAEIRTAVEAATDSNVFTDADHTKLDGIETSADVTDTTNVVAALTAGTNVTIAADGTISSTDTDTQLSTEQVQDIVGNMLTGNTETRIGVTYEDSDGTIDFVVDDMNYTLPLAASGTRGGIKIGYTESGKNYPVELDSEKAYVNVPWTDTNTQLSTEEVQDIIGGMVSSNTETNISVTYDDTNGKLDFVSTDTNTQLSKETVQDYVGEMLSGNTETRIAVTYDDTNNKINFVADDQSYTLPTASSSTLGGVKVGGNLTIDGNGVLNVGTIALTTVQTAANETAHLNLTAQEGDIVVRSDQNKSYVHNGGTAGTMADYTLLLTPTDAVLSVTTTDGTYIDLTPNSAATGAITVTADLSAVNGTSDTTTRFLSKDNTWDVPSYTTDLDHDSLTNYVANEHIDWTTDQGSTNIHTGNYNNTQLSDSEVISAIVASTSISNSDKSTIRSNIGAGSSSFSGDYDDLSNKPTLLQLGTTSTTALAGNTSLLQLGTTSTTALAGDTTTISSTQAANITTNNAKTSFPGFGTTSGKALEGNTSLFSGDYDDLSNKPTLLEIGTTATTALAGNTSIPSGNAIIDWTTDQGNTNIHTGNYNNTQLSNAEVVAAIVASTGISGTDKGTFRTNIGAGTSSFDGDYDSLSNKPTIPSGNQIIDWSVSQSGNTPAVIHADNYTDTNTQLTTAQVRAKFTAGTNVSISNGEISATDTNTTYDVMGSANSYAAGLVLAGNATHGGAFLRKDGTWQVPPDTDTNTNTTYTTSVPSSTTKIRLTGSDSTNDDIEIAGGTNVTVTRNNASKMTISATDTNTTYTAGHGLQLSGTEFQWNYGIETTTVTGSVNNVSTTSGRYYAVQADDQDRPELVVNVPWTDTNTTYSVGDGGLTQKNFTTTLKTKLDNIESNATADQTITAGNGLSGGGTGNVTLTNSLYSDNKFFTVTGNASGGSLSLAQGLAASWNDSGGSGEVDIFFRDGGTDHGTNTLYFHSYNGTDTKQIMKLGGASTVAGTYVTIGGTLDVDGQTTLGTSGTANLYLGNVISPSSSDKGARFHSSNNDFYFDFQGDATQHWYLRDYDGSGGTHTRFSFDFINAKFIAGGDVVAFGSPSDKTLKENIKPIDNALDKVEKLQGVTFDWKEQDITNLKEDIGFIAQDVQKVLPELVRENNDGKLSLRHQGIIPVLLEAIKELSDKIKILENGSTK